MIMFNFKPSLCPRPHCIYASVRNLRGQRGVVISPSEEQEDRVVEDDDHHDATRSRLIPVPKSKKTLIADKTYPIIRHPFIGSNLEKRCNPSYYYDDSIQSAQINKHIYKLQPKKTFFHKIYDEEKRARRKLPVPVSLTGLGLDSGRDVKYWTVKIKQAIRRLEKESEPQCFRDNLTPGLTALLNNNYDSDDMPEIQVLKDIYERETQKEKDESIEIHKDKSPVQFPYALSSELKEKFLDEIKSMKDEEADSVSVEDRKELLDKEFNEYMMHRDVLKYLSGNLGSTPQDSKIDREELQHEMEGWRKEFWRRSYGTPDPNVPPSTIPCGGCGAYLQCCDSGIPGYIPSQKFEDCLSSRSLKREKCQRCEFLEHFNVSLDVSVDPQEYPKIISSIKHKKRASVILMVDLLDFPCSIWPNLVDIIGPRKIYVVGNKVDLLPKDGRGYLERVEESLRKSMSLAGFDYIKKHMRHLSLISAKTGYGVESLISKIFKDRWEKEEIYLVGCTNVGKSTLFNALLQSDLCAARENDLIQRATTSLWPGTTLNLLKFPIRKLEGYQMQQRINRMMLEEKVKMDESLLRRSLWKQTRNPTYATLMDRVGTTFRQDVPFSRESNHPYAKRSILPKPFDENSPDFKNSSYVYDTPGTIYKDQILTLLTTEELLKTVPRELITPRTFSLQPYQTLFVGGIGRIDVIHSRQNVILTVFTSNYLPIHVVYTQEARRFYDFYLGSEMLGVPFGNKERLDLWPELKPVEVDLNGISWEESCGDLVLSSAGWVSVTIGRDESCVLKASTPGGRGMFIRKPSLLPYAIQMKGRRIPGTPCYETSLVTVDDVIGDDGYSRRALEERRRRNYALESYQLRERNKN